MNEEEVKIHILLPYLKEGGVEAQDLSFETSFSIRLGRQVHNIGNKSKRDTAGGRLDILVRRDGVNLLIVEVKREELFLTDEDRDQALSYARLIHPIAPYALVTNGREFNLYETISKDLVKLSDVRFDEVEVSLPNELYINAQRTFFRLDSTNLTSFCRVESDLELEMVRGARKDGKKYIPELHVRREHLHGEISAFLRSNTSALILTSMSGSGKTCELAALTEERLGHGLPTLFFNGSTLESTLADALSDAFDWHFDSELNPARLIRRITALLDESEQLLIVIDAIDEWSAANRCSHLSNFVQQLHGQKVKLIASCRTGALQTFTSNRDNQTFIGRSAQIIDLLPFSSKEFHEAIKKYKCAYNVDVWFETEALELARQSPFFMRILFETAKPGVRTRLTIDSDIVFENYLSIVTSKTDDPQRAIETIREVGKVLYLSNSDEVPEIEVRAALTLSANERLMDALFEQNVLVRAQVSVGEANISFYFQQLRNYVIAFKSFRFHQRSKEEAIKEIGSVDFSTMQGEVHSFYYRLAKEDIKPLYDGRHRKQVECYLTMYANVIDQYAPFLRIDFSKNGTSAIGFSAEILLPDFAFGFFGLRPVDEGDQLIRFYTVPSISYDSPTYLQGVKTPRLDLRGERFVDRKDLRAYVVETEVLPSIKQALKYGRLDESACALMLKEQILGAVVKERRVFSELRDASGKLPDCIQLADVSRCLLRRKLEYRYEEELTQRKIESGDIPVNWTGTRMSYSHSLSYSDRAYIQEKVNDNLDCGIFSTDVSADIDLNRLDNAISLAINRLQNHGTNQVSASTWKFLQGTYGSEDKGSRHRLGEYVVELYLDSLWCYSRIKQMNFPAYARERAPEQEPPPSAFFVLPTAIDVNTPILDVEVMIYYVKSGPQGLHATVVDESAVDYDDRSWSLSVHGTPYHPISVGFRQIRQTLDRHGGVRDSFFFDMPIRTYVYSKLCKENERLEEYFAEISDL